MPLTSSSLRLLAALLLAVPAAACTVVEGRQTVGEYVDDSTITNNIRAKFIEDPTVKFRDVGVSTMNGVVQLSGFVSTSVERGRAGQIAANTKGVRQVRNDIVVR
ncbi:MAG TPA: BON domain-containing protein [Vineibacter sp.]|nr:BON domain-containing protein [Vineibacter sp.]